MTDPAGGNAPRGVALVSLLVGGYFVLARLPRLGWVADYLPRPVLVGYIHGTATVLIVGQLPKLIGVTVQSKGTIGDSSGVVEAIPDTSVATLVLSAGQLAALFVMRRFAPKAPGALIVVVAGITAASLGSLASHGIKLVGPVPSGLRSFGLPDVGTSDVAALAPAAAGMFLVCFADGVLTACSFAGRHGQHVNANRELLALGSANVAAGLTGTFPVGASGSRTTVNDTAGRRTQFVGLFSAATIALVLLFLTGPVAKIPIPCLGAIIVASAPGLLGRREWAALRAAGLREVGIAAVTTAGVVLVGVLLALLLAVGLSILDTVARSAKPHDAVLRWVARLDRYGDVSVHPSPLSWSTDSRTGCSRRTAITSPDASSRPLTPRPATCAGWSSTPRASPISTHPVSRPSSSSWQASPPAASGSPWPA